MVGPLLFSLCLAVSEAVPNIIWIVADDFGYNDLGLHNALNENAIRTPHLDDLAQGAHGHGVLLESAYSQPICSPTRSQLLTGRYQIHTGLQHGVIWPAQPNGLPTNETTVAERLRAVGYTTAAVGKWHLGFYTHKHTPLQRGFDTFYGFWGGGEDYTTHISGGGFDFRDGEAVHRQAKGAYSTELFAARAVRLIEQHSVDTNRPLFLYLAFQATHAPLQAPPRYVERCAHVPNATKEQQDRRMFCAMAVAMDEGVQNITLALKRANMYNNSVIFFTGDNGGQVHAGGNNWPLRGWKGSYFEGGVRAASFVHSPLLPARQRHAWRGLMHVSDWHPTAAALAGAPLPAGAVDGYNVWGALAGNLSSPRHSLLHGIDPIALPRYVCSGPIASLHAGGRNNGSWSFPPPPATTFRRAALRVGRYKLIVGGCAEWDCSAAPGNASAPTGLAPPRVPPPCGMLRPTAVATATLTTTPTPATQHELLRSPPLPAHCRNVTEGQSQWLFDVEADESETCDLSDALPNVTKALFAELLRFNATAVPCRYPDADPRANVALHNGTWSSWA